MIKTLLAKPFKMPKPNYAAGTGCVCACAAWGGGVCVCCLIPVFRFRSLFSWSGNETEWCESGSHDPLEEGALVLHTPRHLSAHQQLSIDW